MVPAAQTINELRKRFKPDAARNLNATYLISVQGEGGGNWLVKIADGQCEFVPYIETEAAMRIKKCQRIAQFQFMPMIWN